MIKYPKELVPSDKGIPKNYYCEFSLDLKDDIVYGVEIYRFDRFSTREKIDIDVIVEYADGSPKFDYISDTEIRKNSMYSRMSSSSKA